MLKIGNLFELATQQLMKEIDSGKIKTFNGLDIIDRAITIRKFIDKHNKKGSLTKAIYGQKVWRRENYLRTGK